MSDLRMEAARIGISDAHRHSGTFRSPIAKNAVDAFGRQAKAACSSSELSERGKSEDDDEQDDAGRSIFHEVDEELVGLLMLRIVHIRVASGHGDLVFCHS